MILTIPEAKRFELGSCFATAAAIAQFKRSVLLDCLKRHANGDWGEIDENDQLSNDLSIEKEEGRIFSRYEKEGVRLWIITEADRSATTILLPSDY